MTQPDTVVLVANGVFEEHLHVQMARQFNGDALLCGTRLLFIGGPVISRTTRQGLWFTIKKHAGANAASYPKAVPHTRGECWSSSNKAKVITEYRVTEMATHPS